MNWTQDLRFAFRMIRKNPWFSTAIVITLALGIGVNTTVFSLVNGVLYKPLPFPGGERLVIVSAENVSAGRDFINMSYADFRDFRKEAGSFEHLEAVSGEGMNLGERGNPTQRYRGMRVSAGIFKMLQVQPIVGRGFVASDEKAGAEAVAVLGHGIWKERYGLDSAAIGRTVRINEKPAVIIGVMPEGFKFPNNEELWMAAVPEAELEKRDNRRFSLVGILKEGRSIAEAQSDLAVVAHRLQQQFPKSHKDHGVRVQTFHQVMNGGPIRLVFMLMLGAVGFVLLIACANVANMLMSRAVNRAREISIRAALGAGRWRIVRQLLIESVLLAAIGGILGLLLARFGIHGFSLAVENVGKPYWIDFSMDYVVFAYLALIVLLSGVVFGIAPAWNAARVDLNDTLKEGARGAGGSRGGFLTGALVVVQFTLAVVLLSGAGLLMRSFLLAQNEFSTLDGERILSGRISLPSGRYPEPDRRQRFFDRLMPRLKSMPGVQIVSAVSNPPGGGSVGWRFELEGQPIPEAERRPVAAGVIAWPDYFRLLGTPVLRGREFVDSDGLQGTEAVIVSRQFVARHYSGQDPIGKRLRLFGPDGQARPWMTVIGVVAGFRQQESSNPVNDSQVFVPYRFESVQGMTVLLRTSGTPSSLAPALRSEVQQLDEDLPLSSVQTLEEMFYRSRWHWRVFGTVFLIFAVVALGMAAVGIYAVMAHATCNRTHEIGIRLALGAGFGSIIRLVLRRGLIQLSLGIGIGLAAALGVCQLMAQLLLKVSPRDPVTLTVVAAVLAAVGLVACWMPARRAARLDPFRALRQD